uniref:Uncharacterized protein n=1 Tax=Peronospora matthiolae TaxID=2874970 RepID=A0AAV1VEC8_9STRA
MPAKFTRHSHRARIGRKSDETVPLARPRQVLIAQLDRDPRRAANMFVLV